MGFLRAFAEGIAFYRTHKPESIQMIKEFLRVSDNAIAEEAHDYYSRITPAKPYPILDGVRGVLEEIAAIGAGCKKCQGRSNSSMEASSPNLIKAAILMDCIRKNRFFVIGVHRNSV